MPKGIKSGELLLPLMIFRAQPLIDPVIESVPAVGLISPLRDAHAVPEQVPLSVIIAVKLPLVICSASVVVANTRLLRPNSRTASITPNKLFFIIPFSAAKIAV